MTTSDRRFLALALLVVIGIAVGVSQLASSDPDGLEYVVEQHGLDEAMQDHAFAEFALAEYGEGLTDNDVVNTAVAGLVGVAVTLALGYGLFRLLARRTSET